MSGRGKGAAGPQGSWALDGQVSLCPTWLTHLADTPIWKWLLFLLPCIRSCGWQRSTDLRLASLCALAGSGPLESVCLSAVSMTGPDFTLQSLP